MTPRAFYAVQHWLEYVRWMSRQELSVHNIVNSVGSIAYRNALPRVRQEYVAPHLHGWPKG